jgi:hypothetical protein
MKVLIVFALCVVVACALPVEETGQNQEADAQLTILEVEPEAPAETTNDELTRAKRHGGLLMTIFWKI